MLNLVGRSSWKSPREYRYRIQGSERRESESESESDECWLGGTCMPEYKVQSIIGPDKWSGEEYGSDVCAGCRLQAWGESGLAEV